MTGSQCFLSYSACLAIKLTVRRLLCTHQVYIQSLWIFSKVVEQSFCPVVLQTLLFTQPICMFIVCVQNYKLFTVWYVKCLKWWQCSSVWMSVRVRKSNIDELVITSSRAMARIYHTVPCRYVVKWHSLCYILSEKWVHDITSQHWHMSTKTAPKMTLSVPACADSWMLRKITLCPVIFLDKTYPPVWIIKVM